MEAKKIIKVGADMEGTRCGDNSCMTLTPVFSALGPMWGREGFVTPAPAIGAVKICI